MNKIDKVLDAIDVFGRKKTTGEWVLMTLYAALILSLDIHVLVTQAIPSGSVLGIVMFTFFVLLFSAALVFQLCNKPPKLFMVVHTRSGAAILREPVTESFAKEHTRGFRGETFSYMPHKDYLRMKETTR